MKRRSFILLLPILYSSSVFASRPSLLGSKASQRRQNEIADAEDLSRIENDEQLERFKRAKLLVSIPGEILVDERLETEPRLKQKFRFDPKFRFVRPWTANFLEEMNKAFMEEFKHPLQVNSAVRTRVYQELLRTVNGNAATTEGDEASSHLTGATIDIAKLKMREVEMWWMRRRLLHLEGRGFIEATEEQHQAVFHIMVSKKWAYPKSQEE